MKYIKLFENWLTPENHLSKIDSIIDINSQKEKNKLTDKPKPQSISIPFDIKNSKLIQLETDKVEGITDAQSKNIIIISKNKEKSGFGIFMYIKDISQSYEKMKIYLSIQVAGYSPCIDESTEMKVLFTDGERMSIYSVNRYNCDQRALFSLSFSEINKFKSKKIETLRIYTSLGKYVQEDLTPKNQDDFYNVINELSLYMDTLLDLHNAVRFDREEMVKSLLISGISPNIKDKNGNTPLHTAVETNNLKLLKVLIEKGGDINIKNSEKMYFMGEEYDGLTIFDLALKKDYTEIIDYLEGLGAKKSQKYKEPSSKEIIKVDQKPNDIINKEVLNKIQRNIVYPEMARRAGIEGTVILKILLGKDGRLKNGKFEIVETPSELLLPAAIKSISNVSFPIITKDGQPIEFWLDVPIKFQLSQ